MWPNGRSFPGTSIDSEAVNPLRRRLTEAIAMAGLRPPLRLPTTTRITLRGKRVLITGASSGIGEVGAERFAAEGAEVIVVARRADLLDALTQRIADAGGTADAIPCDLSDLDAVDDLAATVDRRFGGVDILVNNAGVGTSIPALRETPEAFRRVMDVNVFGAYSMAQACGRVMLPGSSIVTTGSVSAYRSVDLPQAAYTTSKTALLGLTRDLAQQWSGRRGIRVNTLVLGWFPTEMTDDLPEGFLEAQRQRTPMGRIGDVEEAAAALVFLASPASSFVTGTSLVVDGGLLTL